MSKQLQCPNCRSFNIATNKSRLGILCLSLFILGAFFNITLIGIIVGIPMWILAVIIGIYSLLKKEGGNTSCRNCKYKFDATS